MVTGYSGSYRAIVVDDSDPAMQRRLLVQVPDVYADAAVWAAAATSGYDVSLPSAGDEVWVSFERGDSDYPVWSLSAMDQLSDDGGPSTRGFVGLYRGTVVDNNDPAGQQRLQVVVPDVAAAAEWATPGNGVGDMLLPEIGAEVWVEYENGDPQYPRWTGLV